MGVRWRSGSGRSEMKEKRKPIPSAIADYMRYDPMSGEILWKRRPKYSKAVIGRAVGKKKEQRGKNTAYWSVTWKKVQYLAHRVAWFLKTGKQPPKRIDHRDRNGMNNRWENLRRCTHSQNMRNRVTVAASGFTGVYKDKRDGWWFVTLHLGRFRSKGRAVAARRRAAAKIGLADWVNDAA